MMLNLLLVQIVLSSWRSEECAGVQPQCINWCGTLSRTAMRCWKQLGKVQLTPTRAHLHSGSLFCYSYFVSELASL